MNGSPRGGFIVLLAALACWQPAIVSHAQTPNQKSEPAASEKRTQITVRLTAPFQHTGVHFASWDRLFVDLPGAAIGSNLPAKPTVLDDPLVRQVRIGSPKPDVVRITLDLKVRVQYEIEELSDPYRLVITLSAITPPPTVDAPQGPVLPAFRGTVAPLANPVPAPQLPAGPTLVMQRPAGLPAVLATMPEPAAAPAPAPVKPAAVAVSAAEPPPPEPVKPVIASTPVTPLVKPAPGAAAAGVSRTLAIARVSHPPALQDYLGGSQAPPGVSVRDFRQMQPGDGAAASRQTSAYVSYDDSNLYVVFLCKDDPAKVRAHMVKRDNIGDDDSVIVYVDTFHDLRHAYYFSSNPLGIQADGILTEGSGADSNFDTLWYSEGRRTPDGYAVWFAIPFKSLRFSKESSQTWGIALGRTIAREIEQSYWPYITTRQTSFVQQLATLTGLERISPSHNVQMIPYGALTSSNLLNPGSAAFQSHEQFRGGVDSKIVIHDALTLDTTVNPDFSEVESDDPQVTVNQRYEVYFPEKRPFFLENASYFATPIDLFFSRRIVDPEFGGRLTGKLGQWGLGALMMDDRAAGVLVNPSNPDYGDRAVIGVARVERDFGTQSKIGAFVATRDLGSTFNRVGSLDTRIKLSPTWYLTGQAVVSYDRDYGANLKLLHTQGKAYAASLTHSDRHFTYQANYQDFSPNFQADLGFIQRTNIRQVQNYFAYNWRPEESSLQAFGPYGTVGADWDYSGKLQDWIGNLGFAAYFKGPSGFTVSRTDSYEYYLTQGFRHSLNGASMYVTLAKSLLLNGSYYQGSGINYYPAAGLAPYVAKSQNGVVTFTWRPAARLRMEDYYYYTRLGGGVGIYSPINSTAFTSHLFRTKINYQFTRALSLRGILDYDALLPNSGLINQTKYKNVTGDVLLTYLLNPGTALYIGYNGQLQNLRIDPTMPPTLQYGLGPLAYTGRQIFVKISYLLRY